MEPSQMVPSKVLLAYKIKTLIAKKKKKRKKKELEMDDSEN